MTPEVAFQIRWALAHVAEAEHQLHVADRPNAAAREAYLGALAAARAIIATQTGKIAKTHGGTRSEISRLAHLDPRIDRGFALFLADGFEVKSWMDYGDGRPHNLSVDAARSVIAEARRLIAHAESLLAQPEPPQTA